MLEEVIAEVYGNVELFTSSKIFKLSFLETTFALLSSQFKRNQVLLKKERIYIMD